MHEIRINLIRTDGGTQSRAAIDPAVVDEYAADMTAGVKFPAPIVFHDGKSYWLADGFHRVAACEKIGKHHVAVEVKQGTKGDAVWFSCGANSTHGLKRTNADKRRAVEVALQHPKSKDLSARAVADHCGVGDQLVRDVMGDPGAGITHLPGKRTGKDGKSYPARRLPPATPVAPAPVPAPAIPAPSVPVEIKPSSAEQEAAVKGRVEKTEATVTTPQRMESAPPASPQAPLPVQAMPAPGAKLTKADREVLQDQFGVLLSRLDAAYLRMDAEGRERALIFVRRFVARHEREIKNDRTLVA